MEFLKEHFSQEKQKLHYYHFCDLFKTELANSKVKFLKTISFLPFLTQIWQKFGPNPHKKRNVFKLSKTKILQFLVILTQL